MTHLRVVQAGEVPPTFSPRDAAFLERCEEWLRILDSGRADLAEALAAADVPLAAAASRRLLAIGLLFGDNARRIGADL